MTRRCTALCDPLRSPRVKVGLRLVVAPLALVLVCSLAACQGAPRELRGTSVQSGDLLYGRLPAGREVQAFSFEGVEGSLLDFDILADGGNIAAPRAELIDPQGKRVDVLAATQSSRGAASMAVRDVVLLRNGQYRVNVHPAVRGSGVWYRFRHKLKFPEIEKQSVRLTPVDTHPIYVSAPRGGLVAVTVQPGDGSGAVPEIRGVKDPWGGRALDRTQVPAGANPPRLSRGRGGQQVLTFTAPRPGRYTILAAAKTGTAGVVTYAVDVRPPAQMDRVVYHPNTSPHYGLPGSRRKSPLATPAPLGAPLAPPAPPALPGAAPSPSLAPPVRVPAAPVSPTFTDPALANR